MHEANDNRAHGVSANQTVTRLLAAVAAGDQQDGGVLLEVVYAALRAIAAGLSAQERPGHTLDATALVHEVYLRLLAPSDGPSPEYNDRGHFFAVAARAMRRLLVDHARARKRQKRGGDARRVGLAGVDLTPDPNRHPEDLLALDEALTRLSALDARKARLVELRFFAGLGEREAAEALGVSRSTASEEWRHARAWLSAAVRNG